MMPLAVEAEGKDVYCPQSGGPWLGLGGQQPRNEKLFIFENSAHLPSPNKLLNVFSIARRCIATENVEKV